MRRLWLSVLLLGLLSGCDKGPEVALVTGTVTIDGAPAGGLLVKFLPDPLSGTSGPSSFAMTADDGSYDLIYDKDNDLHGAVVGTHRVFFIDSAREDRPPGPRRLRLEYASSGETPLTYEIVSGSQTIDIDLKKP
jgi:hypothetical protein